MFHTSAFHPYIRPSTAPTAEPPLEDALRFVFSPEALLALAQLQPPSKPVELVEPVSPKEVIATPVLPTASIPVSEPLHSPTIHLNEKSRRKRTTFSPEQATRLEAEYLADSYMAREKRLLLAHSLSLSENQVKTWFQNRRAKDKRDRKSDNSSINTSHSRKSSPSRKSSSDSSPTPSAMSSASFVLPSASQIQTASSPVEAVFLCPPTTPPASIIQRVEQFPLVNNIDVFNRYLQSLVSSGSSQFPIVHSTPPPPYYSNPNPLTSPFQHPLQSI